MTIFSFSTKLHNVTDATLDDSVIVHIKKLGLLSMQWSMLYFWCNIVLYI